MKGGDRYGRLLRFNHCAAITHGRSRGRAEARAGTPLEWKWSGAQGLQRDQLLALSAGRIGARAGLALERIEDAQLLADFAYRGQHFLTEQPDAGHPIFEAYRSLALEDAENAGP